MCPWQLLHSKILLNGKLLRSAHPPQRFESLRRHPRRSSHKLQEGCSEVVVEALQDLEQLYDDLVGLLIVDEGCVVFEVEY